jgi:uncharacterized membrane protein YbhN (UPF0104 family)
MRGANAGWLTLAAVVEALSMNMFAWQQRRLLAAFGLLRSPRWRIQASHFRSSSRSPALVALVAAGAPHIAAAAVVLVYRVLSCWLIIPIGLLAWLAVQSTRRRADHERLPRPKERDA